MGFDSVVADCYAGGDFKSLFGASFFNGYLFGVYFGGFGGDFSLLFSEESSYPGDAFD